MWGHRHGRAPTVRAHAVVRARRVAICVCRVQVLAFDRDLDKKACDRTTASRYSHSNGRHAQSQVSTLPVLIPVKYCNDELLNDLNHLREILGKGSQFGATPSPAPTPVRCFPW